MFMSSASVPTLGSADGLLNDLPFDLRRVRYGSIIGFASVSTLGFGL